jgi:hypothetical protein
MEHEVTWLISIDYVAEYVQLRDEPFTTLAKWPIDLSDYARCTKDVTKTDQAHDSHHRPGPPPP